jgi:hypothetical protein
VSPNGQNLLIRSIATWLGLGAAVLGLMIGRAAVGLLVRPYVHVPASTWLIAFAYGSASLFGMYGAWALWHGSQAGRLMCIISGTALIVGFGPAALLRGQLVVAVLLGVTLAGVLCLCWRPAATFRGAGR